MFDINAKRLELECYQKWNKLMKQHRSHKVRQQYYQERKMNEWDHDYTNIVEQMRREMSILRKTRLIRAREELMRREELDAYNELLALAKREQTLRRKREGKKRAQEKAMCDMENPRRVARN